MRKIALGVAAVLLLPGCCTSLACASARANEGPVPCDEDDIQITEDTGYSMGGRSWVATCANRSYDCEVYAMSPGPNGVPLTRCKPRPH